MRKIFYLLMVITLFSCKKNKSDCETWEYYDDCVCLNTSLFGCGIDGCPDGPVIRGKFCGDDLIPVHQGDSTKVIYKQEGQSETIRRFLRKIN